MQNADAHLLSFVAICKLFGGESNILKSLWFFRFFCTSKRKAGQTAIYPIQQEFCPHCLATISRGYLKWNVINPSRDKKRLP